MTTYKGGCLCGAIRYEASVEPMMAGHCQCRDCQRMGGGHASMLGFPEDKVKLTGTPKYYGTKADSGNISSRGVCPNCGSWVVGKTSGMANFITISAGTLDDPGQFKPQLVVYHDRANAWDHLDPALMTFAKMPPMAAE